ncbi:thiol:disulfide interchange protein [Nocardia mangyaensis]|uniref:Thiol:disulfide interchange protein n=1 Tax=Nocardia mangyaensis TaxID=2213200 RepID=A0A1J0VMD2_9NOCA|nr:protein disulfide oxidoreductase [Nocardia mangyaensis]APE33176.1 thiol:disulfide interchange protein [Nocardia mangyaensis]
MKIGRMAAGLLVAAILAVGCGAGDNDSPAPLVPASAPAGPASGPQSAAVPEQLRFTSTTVDGAEFSGESLAGKAAVLWFWAPWCPTCQREAPGIADAAKAHTDVRFVGVAALDSEPAMRDFVAKYDLGFFPNLADVDGTVWQRFGVTQQPAYAFVGADGRVDVLRGSLSESELATWIRQLDRG